MSTLTNCAPVIEYTAEEFAGDMISGDNLLEIQAPPTGFLETNAGGSIGTPSIKYLAVKPLPGYRIDRTMLDVSTPGSWGLVNEDEENLNNTTTHPNGTSQYWFPDEASGISDSVLIVQVYDSLGINWFSCENSIIIEIHINPAFAMPDNDHLIKLDLQGEAVLCEPLPPPPPPPEPDNPPGPGDQEDTVNVYTSECIVTNPPGDLGTSNAQGGDYNIFFANYYDSEYYASSNHNAMTSLDYKNGSGINGMWPPVYDYLGTWQQAEVSQMGVDYMCWESSIDAYQPTWYSSYILGENDALFYEPAATDAPNVISTLAGQLLITNIASGSFSNVINNPYFFHPNENNCLLSSAQQGSSNKWRQRWEVQSTPGTLTYTSLEESPTVEPGGSIIPSSISWYISIGPNPNFDLIADASFVDVHKIITLINPPQLSPFTGNANYNTPSTYIDTNNLPGVMSYKISNESINESDLDINNISITQGVDSNGDTDTKAVKLTIPFRSGLSFDRYAPNGWEFEWMGIRLIRKNKIFINVYPTSI
tara:strand:- start:11768 stop:13372 length:1605 start_codon:yes stop_codon:yes gene_type:complete